MENTSTPAASAANTPAAEKPTLATALARIEALEATVKSLVEKLEAKKNSNPREMTDDDARRIMSGDLKDAKHKEAGEKLGLSYGQVYSCRLGYTFKNIHKEMKTAGTANPWIK